MVDDQIAKTGGGEAFKVMNDQRLAADHQQGLGGMVRQGTHAFPTARGQDHRFHEISGDGCITDHGGIQCSTCPDCIPNEPG